MEMPNPEEIVDHIYEHLNQLEYALLGPQAEVKQATLAKLREIYLRAKQQGDERLYLQAFRLYNRLLCATDEQASESLLETYAERFAQHVSGLVLRTLEETGWTEDKTSDEVAEFLIWLTELLTLDFEQRLLFEP
ncbi:MAG: hypothetical protein GX063_08045 [Firmicutes bacterium]|nr:hypothetical protein [Bacillota bacterium]